MNRSLAIFGATGLVGRTMLALLEARGFPIAEIRLLASDRSHSHELNFRGRELEVEAVRETAFDGVDLALFAVPNELAERWTGRARARGARVVDCSSAFRYRPEVPLVVPEINGALLDAGPGLVANPNCSTIAIVMALKPLMERARLAGLVVSTYQSVSGAGGEALAELEDGVRMGLDRDPPERPGGQPPFAFNVVPHIDRFEDNGYTREEMKIVWEARKILDLPELRVSATAVRVPVRVGHAAAIHAQFDRPVSVAEAHAAWRTFSGLEVVDEPARGRYPTPLQAAGRDPVLVGRARESLAAPQALEFFVASDNLRKGAALNAVQIAERLVSIAPSAEATPLASSTADRERPGARP
jgi:aspartate-semialdehyde dehydrogenase